MRRLTHQKLLEYNESMPNYKRYYLQDYHYIFITIVTFQRQKILIDNIELLRNSFKIILAKYNFKIFAISILKDHIHLIIKLENIKDFSNIISNFKKHFSYNYKHKPDKKDLPLSLIKRKEAGIWQRRFYEHIIRNEEDLQKHLDYIHYNSFKHYNIVPKDWKYSTFKKFVDSGYYDLNWCDYNHDIELE